jgi:hypothetical protein
LVPESTPSVHESTPSVHESTPSVREFTPSVLESRHAFVMEADNPRERMRDALRAMALAMHSPPTHATSRLHQHVPSARYSLLIITILIHTLLISLLIKLLYR